MTQRYNCNQSQKAIYTDKNGFIFGSNILGVKSATTLNQDEKGWCHTGKDRFYDIEGDVSPLTN